MQRTSTTVVALVGDRARECVTALGRSANVVAHVADPDRGPLERAVDAWAVASRTHAPYFAHDADPLAAVVDAWVRRYDEEGPAGELEVAVAETVARWRARSIELPDYYLVLDAETWGETRRHWYLGVLHDAGPARVVPVASDPLVLADTVGHLAAGRWWPDVDRLLDGVDRVVPDRVGRVSATPG
ncbi:MAG TPA: hypothetical protein VFC99_22050 [Acidimicrobiia bacterium]|nr:hypothetical protein [Acidimicrobiia bacterium]